MTPERRDQLLDAYRAARIGRDPQTALGFLAPLLAAYPHELGLLLDQVETLLDLARVEPAERICAQVLAIEPANRRAHIALVQASRIRKDNALLHQRLDAAFAVMQPDTEMLVERGELHLARGDQSAAEQDFAAALAITQADRRARLGHFHAGRGRVPPAEEFERIRAVFEVSAPEPALRLDRADALIRLGQVDAAEADARSVLGEQPADPRAWMIMLQAARARRDPALLLQRIDAARAAVPAHPEFGRPFDWDRAAALVTLGRFDEVQALLAHLAPDGAADPDTHLELGRLMRGMGNRRSALVQFEAALAQAPDHPAALLDACTEMTALGMDQPAERLASCLAKLDGQAVVAAMCHGYIRRLRGDHAGALEYFRSALTRAPEHHRAALDAAAELAALGDFAAAEALVNPVLQNTSGRDPATATEALLRLAHIARLQSDRPTALRRLREAMEVDGDHPDVLAEFAAECREQGRFDEAGAALDRLGALQPQALSTLLARGHLARRRGQRAQALIWYATAHQAYPAAADPLAEMATEQRALNQPHEADNNLRRALVAEPGHLDATIRLAEQHLIAERYDACIATCAELHRRRPRFVPAWLVGCRALAARNGAAAALALLDQAHAQLGPHPELIARRIDLLRDIGDYPAIRNLVDPTQTQPIHPALWASGARALLRFAAIDEIEDWFARAPKGDIGTSAEVEELRAIFAEILWQPAAALTHYRNAVRIDPNRSPLEQDIARLCLIEGDIETAAEALGRYIRLTAGERRLRGESTKPSQTHVGQLLDEYRLDADTVAELRELKTACPQTRIAGARAIVARFPDSTAAASFLLMAMRAAGLFDPARPPAPTAGADAIGTTPRRIMQFWFQPNTPPDIAALMQTWQNHNPGWQYARFDDAAAQAWLRCHPHPGVLTAYLRSTEKAQKADLFRLAWLSIEGGVYADADDRCFAPLDFWLKPGLDFMTYQEDFGTLGNNILACAPGHPVIHRALTLAVASVLRGDNDLLWLSTGPGLLSRAFAQTIPLENAGREAFLAQVRILDRRLMGSVMAMSCAASYKLTDNHWLQNLVK